MWCLRGDREEGRGGEGAKALSIVYSAPGLILTIRAEIRETEDKDTLEE